MNRHRADVTQNLGLRIGLAAAVVLGILLVVDWFAVFAIGSNCSGTDASESSTSSLCSSDVDTAQTFVILLSLVPLAVSCFGRRRSWTRFLAGVTVGAGVFALLGVRLRIVRGPTSSGLVDAFFIGLPLLIVAVAVLALLLMRGRATDFSDGWPGHPGSA